jgi:hypothetical protein
MVSDGDNGSVSSKRVITLLAFILCGVSFMLDQIMGLKADPRLFDAMMYIVVAGLGFTASEKFAPKNKEK